MPQYKIPAGYHTVTPYLIVKDVSAMLGFLQEAFAAEIKICERDAAGVPVHGEAKVGSSWVMLAQASAQQEATCSQLYLYIEDVDACYAQFIAAAGAISLHSPVDKHYGDRVAGAIDAYGNTWWLASRLI